MPYIHQQYNGKNIEENKIKENKKKNDKKSYETLNQDNH